jgi:hypothetical protein
MQPDATSETNLSRAFLTGNITTDGYRCGSAPKQLRDHPRDEAAITAGSNVALGSIGSRFCCQGGQRATEENGKTWQVFHSVGSDYRGAPKSCRLFLLPGT